MDLLGVPQAYRDKARDIDILELVPIMGNKMSLLSGVPSAPYRKTADARRMIRVMIGINASK